MESDVIKQACAHAQEEIERAYQEARNGLYQLNCDPNGIAYENLSKAYVAAQQSFALFRVVSDRLNEARL
ncbi:MAG TPA: hypothetical protein VJN69_14435 [Candidatus Acidoferrales bacterium]|nr:hypothetical protein [Candidatus Acidoferrales bacterium]